MELTRRLQVVVLFSYLIALFITPTHTRQFGLRPKREYGSNLYLPEKYVIPGGEGNPSEWSDWSAPSECSRTCGGGVSTQTRTCRNVDAYGAPRCSGGSKKHFSCNTQDCPENEPDFRHQQCSYFDEKPFEGIRYEWVPYLKAPNPCELNCMPRGERFYYRHKAKVIDGTRCNDESNDVCVDGQCQPVGCDLMLGSTAREDKCRTCNGDGSGCKTVDGTITKDDLQVGYNDILLIPAGATNIEIREKSPSNNYLALRNASNHYYLNGNWRIDFPRPLTFAGSIWHYDRRPQGFAAPDHISCVGPIDEAIYLVLLYQDRNVGVHYEYSVPEATTRLGTESDTYAWSFAPYGECSSKCGGGVRTRRVTCNSQSTLKPVDDSLCDATTRPEDTQPCSQESCPPQWTETEWSRCPAPCGGTGTQTREVKCEEILADGQRKPLDDAECLQRAGNKPATEKQCSAPKICPQWHTGAWKPCSKLCGDGVQTRGVKCYRKNNGKVEVLKDEDCEGPKPETSKPCVLRPCEGVDWITSQWSGCKVCGLTEETRTAHCASKSGKIYNDTFCANRNLPELTRACNETTECEFQWFSSQWSKCSVECGKGVQTRNVLCAQFGKDGIKPADDESKCEASEKPENKKECDTEKKCEGQWFTGPWNDCSKPCGGGDRKRKVICIGDGKPVPAKSCGEDSIAFSSEECNKEPCVEDELIPVDTTSKPIEEDDEGEEYCDEEDEDTTLVDTTTDDISSSSISSSSEGESTESSLITDELMEMQSDSTSTYDTSDSSTNIISSTYEGSGDEEGSGSTEVSQSSSESESTSPSGSSESTSESSSEASSPSSESSDSTESSEASSAQESSTQASSEGTSESSSESAESSTSGSTESESSSSSEATTELSSSESTTEQSSSTSDESTSDSSSQSSSESTTELSSSESTSESSSESTDASSTEAEDSSSTTEASSTDGESTTPASTDSTEAGASTESSESTSDSSSEASSESSSESATDTTQTEASEATSSTESSEGTSESSTEVSGSTDATESTESTQSSESTSEQSTQSSISESDSTTDIWSSSSASESDSTDEEDLWGSTPNTLEAIVTSEQKPRKCKPRPEKPSACLKSKFGCCADNKTAAAGPFDEGCKTAETCKETKFGCCPDGVSAAKGKKDKGCPEPLCKSSLFGCCKSDGKTEAEGENQEGCPIITTTTTTTKAPKTTTTKAPKKDGKEPEKTVSRVGEEAPSKPKCTSDDCAPCTNEPFGCCRDGKTPAHGPNQEGCCLETQYGCCPDNIQAARGPNLEDCDCNYSPYGCCPDNKTAARGYENAGCGCEHEKHGCCPDKITAAKGPSFEGCECHTYQFGCCPDGVTIQQGPHGYGCHCSQTKFKCCSDGITAATGENFEGCTCATSKYGCCPDGVTDAQGSQFEGCENIPTVPQKACSITKDSGHCSNYTVKYFFDMEYGGCSRFWYSGCDGNENRFESLEDCKSTCEAPVGKDACLVPKIHGPCTGYYQKFYYDSDRNICSPFVYGGCLGNTNKFETLEECQSLCVVDETLPACEQPLEEGPCNGNFERWYYHKDQDTCLPFRYGGCKGTKNNFVSEQACKYQCKTPGVQKSQCALPKETGKCQENKARWYFSQSDNKCMPFYFTGCDGNKNSYVTLEECEEKCPRNITKDQCHKAAETGNCQNYEARWYFDTKEDRCRQFYYGGCGGNDNNFVSEEACTGQCKRKPVTEAPSRQQPQQPQESGNQLEPFRAEHCLLEADTGPCRALEPRYYYNSRDGVCDVFGYGGCRGNQNNFKTLEECEGYCGNVQDLCSLPPVYGRCQENVTRFYYDHRNDECYQFEYSGCRGNKNNFYSERDCAAQCKRQQQPEPPQEPEEPEIDPRLSRDELCQQKIEECQALRCPYGISRTYDENQCEHCECENPCRNHPCPEDSHCAVDIQADPELGSTFAPVCRKINKPGECPALGPNPRCDIECYTDADCRGDNKCCSAGCSSVCVPPESHGHDEQVASTPPPYRPEVPQVPAAVVLEEKSEEELNVVQPEGQVATLRCYATGYPLPTVTWRRGAIVINTNQGRFVLSSTGDLQIVQVHKSDSGTYVCVADNGIGEPVEREVKLNIADPVPSKTYILGDANTTKIVEFNQPATVRCMAGGYPKPIVSWWRGTDMLPLKSTRFEVNRDYSLVFNSIELSDLGLYICQAYSGQGKPVSVHITLKAIGPVHANTTEDEQYLKYVIDAQPLQPVYPPYRPPPPTETYPIEPVSANIILPNGNTFVAGNDVSIQCEVRGYPQPNVRWLKNGEEIQESSRIRISDAHTLTIYGVQTDDSGGYECHAENRFGSTFHREQINIEGAYVPANCIDNAYFANCKLIVKAKYCGHQYYARFCCKSCTLAGQFSSSYDTNLLK